MQCSPNFLSVRYHSSRKIVAESLQQACFITRSIGTIRDVGGVEVRMSGRNEFMIEETVTVLLGKCIPGNSCNHSKVVANYQYK